MSFSFNDDTFDNGVKAMFAGACLFYVIYVGLILAILAAVAYGLWTWLV